MNLPDDVEKIAATFTKLDDARKRQILDHIKANDGARRQATVAQIIGNGGLEGEFMTHIFGKDAPAPPDAPQNKKIGPPMTKRFQQGHQDSHD